MQGQPSPNETNSLIINTGNEIALTIDFANSLELWYVTIRQEFTLISKFWVNEVEEEPESSKVNLDPPFILVSSKGRKKKAKAKTNITFGICIA